MDGAPKVNRRALEESLSLQALFLSVLLPGEHLPRDSGRTLYTLRVVSHHLPKHLHVYSYPSKEAVGTLGELPSGGHTLLLQEPWLQDCPKEDPRERSYEGSSS